MVKKVVHKFIILCLIPLCFGTISISEDTNQIRSQLEKAPFDEEVATNLLNNLRGMEDKDALHTAFLASAEGIMCIHTASIFKKMKYANNAIEKADEAVHLDANDYEIRFIRFTIQSQIPKIFGKSSDLKQDKEYLIDNFNSTQLEHIPYRSIEEMVHIMDESKIFTDSEIIKLKATLYSLSPI